MRIQITLKSGAQIEADVKEWTTKTTELIGLTGAEWTHADEGLRLLSSSRRYT